MKNNHEIIIKKLLKKDQFLIPYRTILEKRLETIQDTISRITFPGLSIEDFASAHEFFGLHKSANQWIFREWAPNAKRIFIIGEFSDWKEKEDYALTKVSSNGNWEIKLPLSTFKHKDLFRLKICFDNITVDRIPAYARRIHQDLETNIFNAQVHQPEEEYQWIFNSPPAPKYPLIYETHIGMAQDKLGIGTYKEFIQNVLPRIINSGYNTIQLMGIQHHPYYASFGYHVSSFFAPYCNFGSPTELKQLIDTAHGHGLRVFIDIVHSHAVTNETEGLSRFDGTLYQYFHTGEKGYHKSWDSRCFDYGKIEVLHFLLSNLRYWLDNFNVDGFRMDGITSMLYFHHGINKSFLSYKDYFDESFDDHALAYLSIANLLVHSIKDDATMIAEDVSGFPGLCIPSKDGGVGFDYRFAMGIPDYWIKIIKEIKDENWHMGELWFQLTNRRNDEKTISYVESHDQALVGDQSLFFRLAREKCYTHMYKGDNNLIINRAIALHKMIRLLTICTAGNGYLNFMGNEFGHPDWIDFPREGNNWSYFYARRLWHIADDPNLKFRQLNSFDQKMIGLVKSYEIYDDNSPKLLIEHNIDKILCILRGTLIFVFNFNPSKSFENYEIITGKGKYKIILDSDDIEVGGQGRISNNYIFESQKHINNDSIFLYIPARTAFVLSKISQS